VCPGSDEYVLGSLLFGKAVIHLENGKDIVLKADGNSAENVYISGMSLDGHIWNHNFLRHSDLKDGAKITFSMSPVPDMTRGTALEDRPYSFTDEK